MRDEGAHESPIRLACEEPEHLIRPQPPNPHPLTHPSTTPVEKKKEKLKVNTDPETDEEASEASISTVLTWLGGMISRLACSHQIPIISIK